MARFEEAAGSHPFSPEEARLSEGTSWQDAMRGYHAALTALVARYPNADVLELGGGRWPSFRFDQMPANLASYTVNDISEDELALLPPGYQKACFDVSGDASLFEGRYDVVFSRFLAEHVRDGKAMHRNVHQVLKPGGVAFHLIPTLYASPFVLNRLLPERLGGKLLDMFLPRRAVSPKFPAYYSACHGDTPGMRNMLREIGYSRVEIRNFYGHFYYERLPVLREMESRFTALAKRKGWSWCSTYAYLTLYK